MSKRRQKNQLKLTFVRATEGEAFCDRKQGYEADVAIGGTENLVATQLMEEVADTRNLMEAFYQVRKNKGKPGIDLMTVEQLGTYLLKHHEELRRELLSGAYKPEPVRRVEIPKATGGKRMLGIPCVKDRLVQQALLQVVQKYWDPTFSDSSYGFRPGRSQYQAIQQAQKYVGSGLRYVVDLDLENFFNRVNHDILMGLVAKRVQDKRVLKLIRAFLNAGVMIDGVVQDIEEGTPQGGPLSPWLSNVMLHELDRELERRKLRFVRYADDCNVYVNSERAGLRVMQGITEFLEERLKLKVNAEKSAVAHPWTRKFLGFSFTEEEHPRCRIAPQSLDRAKTKLRELTCPKRGRTTEQIVTEVAQYLTGWMAYYAVCEVQRDFDNLERWVRRRLRALMWTRWKTPKKRFKELIKRGVAQRLARRSAGTSKGPWRLSSSPALHQALPNVMFRGLGLPRLSCRGTTQPAEPPCT
jgi:RNA-directed DNA polymerase